MHVAVILLAAGRASRFGGDKLTFTVNGESMIDHALSLYRASDFSARILTARPQDAVICTAGRKNGWKIAPNDRPEDGISRSIRIGIETLQTAKAPCDGVLFAVADQPYLRRETVLRLRDAFDADPAHIAVLACGRRQGNPAIFPVEYLPALCRLSGDHGGVNVMRAHPQAVRLHDLATPEELSDMDYREERKP